jgi:hypothetical protein
MDELKSITATDILRAKTNKKHWPRRTAAYCQGAFKKVPPQGRDFFHLKPLPLPR